MVLLFLIKVAASFGFLSHPSETARIQNSCKGLSSRSRIELSSQWQTRTNNFWILEASSDDENAKKSEKEKSIEDESKSNSSFLKGMFQKKSEKSEEGDDEESKKGTRQRIKDTFKRVTQFSTSSKNEDPKEKESASPSTMRRIQSLLSSPFSSEKNSTTTTNDIENSKSGNPLTYIKDLTGSLLSSKNSDDITRRRTRKDEEWIPVFPKTRISPGEMVPVTVAGIDLLIIASKDASRLYCIANSCPHLGTPLETGRLTRLPTEDSTNTPGKNNGAGVDSAVEVVTTKADEFMFSETELTNILQQDGCEDCIVCPLHKTAFALKSGEVRGEWCPYPPVIGKVVGAVKPPTSAAVFGIRTRGKNVEVLFNTPLEQ